MDHIQECMEALIQEFGPEFLEENPWEIYEALEEEGVDAKEARMVLTALTAEAPELALVLDAWELSERLQEECCLQASAADRIASLFKELYSPEKMAVWDSCTEKGFLEFCEYSWVSGWTASTAHFHMENPYEAEIELNVISIPKLHDALLPLLQENPDLTAEEIWKHVEDSFADMLDREFESFVQAQESGSLPDMDKFSWDAAEDWCSQRGLHILTIHGSVSE